MINKEQKISGCIYAEPDKYARGGFAYVIRPKNGMGWGLPTRDITPDDLRAIADHLENSLKSNVKVI